jgi:hypothetical protein
MEAEDYEKYLEMEVEVYEKLLENQSPEIKELHITEKAKEKLILTNAQKKKKLKRINNKAFNRFASDPHHRIIEKGGEARQLIQARSYNQAMFGDPASYRQATFTGDEIKSIIETIDLLMSALGNREELVVGVRAAKKGSKSPNPRVTKKSLTVESMKLWRKEWHTLEDFIDGALNGSIDGLSMEELVGNNREFILDWDDLVNQQNNKPISYATLEKYWAAAR